jgi:hypothetical protein
MADLLPCLYCGDTTQPRTIEHVLQAGFSANLTLSDDVCTVCNSKVFSPLDTCLINFVRTYLQWDRLDQSAERIVRQHGLGLLLDEASESWISVRFGWQLEPVIPPQVIFLGHDRVRFVGDRRKDLDYKERFAQIRRELTQPGKLSLKVQLWSARQPIVEPALI